MDRYEKRVMVLMKETHMVTLTVMVMVMVTLTTIVMDILIQVLEVLVVLVVVMVSGGGTSELNRAMSSAVKLGEK